MAYSSIKDKTGKCPLCPAHVKETKLIGGKCPYHYWQGRSDAKGGYQIKPKSDKKMAMDLVYKALAAQFLKDHPICGCNLPGCTKKATDVHHKAGRGSNMVDTTTWLATCRPCHGWITEHSKEAIELGLSNRRNTAIKK